MNAMALLPQQVLSDNLPGWFSHDGPQADLVISSRIRLARNLADHRYTFYAAAAERKEIFDTVASVLDRRKEFAGFSTVNCALLPPLDRELLLEKRIISPDLVSIEGDRGVAIDASGNTSIMINEEDHLRLHSFDSGFRAEEIWERITRLDDQLGRYLPFAYEARRGFLTSCPTNSGTGLRASFLLHLPGLALTKTIDQVLLGASQMGISTRGFFGEHSEVVGNLFQLSNQATLGAREEEFLKHTRTIIEEVVTHERTARQRVLDEAGVEFTDKMYRSWGILQQARMLTMKEFLNLSSALRMGIDGGIFKEMTIEQLNRLTLSVMPAHLQRKLGKVLDRELRHFERAALVRAAVAFPARKSPARKPRKSTNTTSTTE